MKKGPAHARRALTWSIAALALAVCASVALLFVPAVTSGETEKFVTPTNGPPRVIYEEGESETLLEADGGGAVLLLVLPIVITAVPVLLRNHSGVHAARVLAAIALIPFLPIGYFTIGGLYLPSEIALLAALRRKEADEERAGDRTHLPSSLDNPG